MRYIKFTNGETYDLDPSDYVVVEHKDNGDTIVVVTASDKPKQFFNYNYILGVFFTEDGEDQ